MIIEEAPSQVTRLAGHELPAEFRTGVVDFFGNGRDEVVVGYNFEKVAYQHADGSVVVGDLPLDGRVIVNGVRRDLRSEEPLVRGLLYEGNPLAGSDDFCNLCATPISRLNAKD